MQKVLKFLVIVIVTSLYFFPFEFRFLPGINTKMVLASLGLVLFIIDYVRKFHSTGIVNKGYFQVVGAAVFFSLLCLCSTLYNNTIDYSYVTYVVSMAVWLAGAYFVVRVASLFFENVSVLFICDVLIAVSIMQCSLALLIDNHPEFKEIVDRLIVGFDFVSIEKLNNVDRLYGIGAALDVAGTRFAAVLTLIAFCTLKEHSRITTFQLLIYLFAFVFITVVGNMMARTTVVGALIAVLYWVVPWTRDTNKNRHRILGYLGLVLGLALPFIVYKYNIDESFRIDMRFAFEGFFSLVEKGEWEVNSNDILKSMIVFPDNIKTWIIGDGYFVNPKDLDSYYVGEYYMGYYKGTDIGYLRFLFYCGLLGLSAFVLYFCKVVECCVVKNPEYRSMFYLLLLLNFIIWFKVSTDIFVVFALFMALEDSSRENESSVKEV